MISSVPGIPRILIRAIEVYSMKKQVILSAALAAGIGLTAGATGISALSFSRYGMAGCGVGSMIIKDEGPAQIFAATTNGTFSQTVGMTFGISNCPRDEALIRVGRAEKQQEVFVTVNFEALEQEMAAGKGDKLSAFSDLLGCKDKATFGKVTKTNYKKFFSGDRETTPADLLKAVKGEVVAEDSSSCKF